MLAQATNKSVEELTNANNIGNWHLILTGDILQNVLTDSTIIAEQNDNSVEEQVEESTIDENADVKIQ